MDNRKNVTDNNTETFEQLAAQLRANGFDVDHFHGMDLVDGEEMITHFQEFGGEWDNDRQHTNNPQGWDSLVADLHHE